MKLIDDRLAPSPTVRRVGNELRLRMRVLTPMRLTLVQELLLFPLIAIWKLILLLFIIDTALDYFGIYSFFTDSSFTRREFAVYMTVPVAFWLIERFGRWPITRMLFGKTIRICISDDTVRIKTGVFYKSYSRTHRIAFAQIPFESAVTPPFKCAKLLVLIIGETRRKKISEIVDARLVGQIVNNLNVALSLHAQDNGRDVDPVRQRLARLAT